MPADERSESAGIPSPRALRFPARCPAPTPPARCADSVRFSHKKTPAQDRHKSFLAKVLWCFFSVSAPETSAHPRTPPRRAPIAPHSRPLARGAVASPRSPRPAGAWPQRPRTANRPPPPVLPKPTPHDLQPPTYDPRPPTYDLRPLTYDLRPPTYDLRPMPHDLRPMTSDLCPTTYDLRPMTSDL